MAKKSSPNDVLQQIEKHYASLSPSGKAIAHYLQQNPIAVLSQSTSLIAEKTATSKATVSRFFRQLGFDSHQQAKDTHVQLREQGVPVVSASSNTQQLESEIKNLSHTFEGMSMDVLKEVASLLAKANQITLIGFRNAYPIALHFRQQLKQIRTSIRLLPQPGQTLSEDIIDLGENDLVVLFGFRRRTRQFKFVLNSIKHCKTVLITDPTGQIYRDQVNHLLVCHIGSESPFDSYAAPMSLVASLCNLTYEELGEEAAKRVEAITDVYIQMDELESPRR
ncbi:rpiR family transcriptional regulator [Alteromonas sp. KUL42]|uniref:MurR/RpiR family transcriptional regulator n=1 Tax=Alteromonas sp. KUL42 TaxID=2480797 RepID=UPI0007932646|nr:MurR/RpiR family transcriptional regulator [Alteromonas sp. KUL42]KXJ58661.1 MAG: RpiR family transcriptional regulator [Alteromonas sp. Nap_26]TAP34377.1 MurR/RpiR family transcriptional regulator [Alteromonas sp. KUL42]GEA07777.1 rpiR family transcriptional regulator [Alteromonas sp. KUL42]